MIANLTIFNLLRSLMETFMQINREKRLLKTLRTGVTIWCPWLMNLFVFTSKHVWAGSGDHVISLRFILMRIDHVSLNLAPRKKLRILQGSPWLFDDN